MGCVCYCIRYWPFFERMFHALYDVSSYKRCSMPMFLLSMVILFTTNPFSPFPKIRHLLSGLLTDTPKEHTSIVNANIINKGCFIQSITMTKCHCDGLVPYDHIYILTSGCYCIIQYGSESSFRLLSNVHLRCTFYAEIIIYDNSINRTHCLVPLIINLNNGPPSWLFFIWRCSCLGMDDEWRIWIYQSVIERLRQ